VDGRPFKDGYRRFKIKWVVGIDDYAMMKEILRRRFEPKRGLTPLFLKVRGQTPSNKKFSPESILARRGSARPEQLLPDLVVIDGGKGHLNVALGIFQELGLDLPAIGIAKEFEELFLPGKKEPILLPPQSRALRLVQRLRDEAHRFAIGYHRLLRGKKALTSALDQIPGIGPRKKQDLLVRFGSVEAMRRAPIEEFTQVRGISKMLAERVLHHLKK